MTPLGDPVSALVYSAADPMSSPEIAGRWLMEKRELKTLVEKRFRFDDVAAAGAGMKKPPGDPDGSVVPLV